MENVHVIGELGLEVAADGDRIRGRGGVSPMMHVPGTTALRASVLSAWSDTLLGLIAVQAMAPRVPVTLALDVFLTRAIVDVPVVDAIASVTKSGSTVVASTVEYSDGDGHRLATAHSMFMANPDPRMTMPTGSWALDRLRDRPPADLPEPYADRVGCRRLEPGVAVLPVGPRVGNQSNTLNGGIVALVAEEAALSTVPHGDTIGSMILRFLRPVRTGPAVARAVADGDVAEVAVSDDDTGALAVLATLRTLPPTRS